MGSAASDAPLIVCIIYMSFAPHAFKLDVQSRSRGIAHLGLDSSLIAKLDSGEPVTIALLGASVGLNAGCFTQPGSRCMLNNGQQPTSLLWGEPRWRPFKGFLVRWFEWFNATWPHPQHRIVNAAKDATSMETIVPCLFSHLPASFDLLFVEGGSMFPRYANDGLGPLAVLTCRLGISTRDT